MNLVIVQNLIETEISTNWSTTSIKWQNISFIEPNTAWISVDIKPGSADTTSLGANGKNQQFGNVWINVFYPVGAVLSTMLGYVDTLKGILDRKCFAGGLQFEAPQIMDIGADEDDKWYQVSIRFPFYFFE